MDACRPCLPDRPARVLAPARATHEHARRRARGARAPRRSAASPCTRAERRRTSSSTSSGAASAPAPSACSGRAACRPSPAWAIRWCRATNRSAASARPAPAPGARVGERVFVPGANCFGDVRGLFGGAAARLVVPGRARHPRRRATSASSGVLLALAATAYHAIVRRRRATHARPDRRPRRARPPAGAPGRARRRAPHRRSGRRNPQRAQGADGLRVVDPAERHAPRLPLRSTTSAATPTLLDTLIARLAPGGEIVLAGFYSEPLSFAFPPAFMREARIRVAAEWQRSRPARRARHWSSRARCRSTA